MRDQNGRERTAVVRWFCVDDSSVTENFSLGMESGPVDDKKGLLVQSIIWESYIVKRNS